MKPLRVVSLVPAATEALYTLGLGGRLVGRSHECDHPAEVTGVPTLTRPRVEIGATSAQIDQQVKARLAAGQPLYDLDLEQLRELKPEVIITQDQCSVCALDTKALEQALVGWPCARPRLIAFNVRRFADLWTELRRLADELDASDEVQAAIRHLKERAADVVSKACLLKRRQSVLCLEWIEPLMAAGHWMPDLIELAGGSSCFAHAGEPSPALKWQELAQIDPDLIVLVPCGFNLERTRAEAPTLAKHPEWPELRAVRKSKIYLSDGNQFFNRPGPRLVESLEILAEILQPDLFPLGWSGRGGWQKL